MHFWNLVAASCAAAALPRLSLRLACGTMLLLTLDAGTAFARRGEAPLSPVGRGSIGEPALRVAAPDVSLLKSEDIALREDGQKTLRYAESIAVSVSPATDGRWEVLADGRRLWRMEVEGPGATDLNVGFTDFELPFGAKLWLISTEADYYEGPYTHEDNAEHGELWVPVVPGSRAILELQLPAQTKSEPRLVMTHVGYGYKDVFSMNGLPKQGSCNNDVICPEGDPWRDQIQSVAVYSLGGSLFCTGQMVMDADSTFRPFFLTAYHCGLTAANAPSLTVYWNFESPTCGALSGGSLSDNQTGAVFRTRRQDVDMCLVELDEFPDPLSEVFYTGWDRSGDVPQGSVGIHHPNTDEKSISFNDDPLTTSGSCIASSTNTHWFVDNWEDGTTEPGSSGSGLWDPDSKLLVGFLSGGLASCTTLDYDCYGKFSVAWDGTSASTRLRDWLDPSGTGVSQVQGSFPSGDGLLTFASVAAVDDCQGTSDGVLEPGESATILLGARAVLNDVTGISGILVSSTPGVTIEQGAATWPDILVGATDVNVAPFVVTLDASVACYADVAFVATLTDANGGTFVMPFTLSVGQVQSPAGLPLAIPDGNATGVISSFTVGENVVLTDVDVRVQIDHSWVGDLRIQLRSPAGTLVTLLDRPGVPASTYGCSDNDLDVTFDDGAAQSLESYCAGTTPWFSGTAQPTQALAVLNGESTAGTWQLIVADFVGADTGSIVDWQLITTPGIGQGTCEPCENAAATTLQVSTTATQRVSVVVVPDGSGDRLDNAQFWDGVPGSTPSRVDATVNVRVETAAGDPVAGFAAVDLVLGSTAGNLALCQGAGSADAPTDANGGTTFSGAIAAGGIADVGSDERMLVVGTGLNSVYTSAPGLEILFNSPDLNGDGEVNLIDLAAFAPAFTSQTYDYAADYAWDGTVDLRDFGVFSLAYSASCGVEIAKQVALPVASGSLGISFDAGGTVTTTSLVAGQEIDAYVVLRGDVAREGIRGWEAALRTSDNVRVIATEALAGGLDAQGGGVFAVGTAQVEGLRDADGVLALARVRLSVTDAAAAFLYLDASPVASRETQSPVVLVTRDGVPELAALTSTDAPLASLNDAHADAPGTNVVTRVSLTNVPNPFNPSTEIEFALPQAGRVEIRVYDVSGRLVRRFELGDVQAGVHSTIWRGEDQNGREVVSGVYFSRLYVDGIAAGTARKMSLLK